MYNSKIRELNSPVYSVRMDALGDLSSMVEKGELVFPSNDEVNNHVHTMFSFSPYSPAGAVFAAASAGLKAVGLMDHDTVAGGMEFLEAGRAFNTGTTVGFEIRVSFRGTPFAETRLNNPDSKGIAYIAVHGINSKYFDRVQDFLAPLRAARNKRNRRQVDLLNSLLDKHGFEKLDFDDDVLPLSQAGHGGTVTERHILAAFAGRIMESFGRGRRLIEFLEGRLDIDLPARIREYLQDEDNPHYLYDLIGVLKGSISSMFVLRPDEEECLPADRVVKFALSINAVPAYSYLGDVGESPTGDKKAQKFEDDYLDELFPVLKDLGFLAVTYMPPRNTRAQLLRIMELCRAHDLMQISGVDINSSRQSFNCPEIQDEMFSHLNTSTWALIAHEKLVGYSEDFSMFKAGGRFSALPLDERIKRYAEYGKRLVRDDERENERIIKELEVG